jgi:hypothetical protein
LRAASASTSRRVAPHTAGQVTVAVSSTGPTVRVHSSTTRLSTAAISSTTGSSRSPSSTVPSSTRRLGFGSNRAGSSRAL